MGLTVLAACGGGSKGAAPAAGSGTVEPKTISVAISENAVTLDPHYTSQTGVDAVRDMVFEMLVGYEERVDGSIEYVPKLCETYSHSDDGKVWTFNLRKGVKFTNGEDFTSDDCAVTFQRLIDHSDTLTIGAIYWKSIEKYETPDDYTFILYMKEPSATLEIALNRTAIFAGDAFRQYGDDYINKQMMDGTGPWKLEEWVDGQYARFTKNNNYWGDFRSYYDEVYLRFITEESTAIASMLAGDIKVYARSGGVTRNSLPLFNGRDSIALNEQTTTSSQYFGLQCRAGHLFNDIRARQAFSLAIDRQAIIESILPGAIPNSSLFVAGTFGYDETMPQLEYNPEKARQLLQQTGYKGERIMLSSNTGTTMSSEVLLAVSDMLNEVGFNTATQVVESATLLDMRLSGNYDVFFVNIMPTMSDLGEILTQRVMQDYHQSHFKDEKVNALITQSNQEFDHEKREALLKEINHLLTADLAPVITLLQLAQSNPYYKGVTGFQMTSFGQFNYARITYDPALAK
jgi:peptide/nickel transport system substrate-binding protein